MLKKGAHDAPRLEGFPVLVLPIPVVHAIVLHDSPAMRLHRHPPAPNSHPTMQGLRQRDAKEALIGIHSNIPSFQEVTFQSQVCPATARHARCSTGDCKCCTLAGSADNHLYGDPICVHPQRSRPEVCAHIAALDEAPLCAATTSMLVQPWICLTLACLRDITRSFRVRCWLLGVRMVVLTCWWLVVCVFCLRPDRGNKGEASVILL